MWLQCFPWEKSETSAGLQCPAGVWRSSPRLASRLCHPHVTWVPESCVVRPSTASTSGKRTQARAKSFDDPEVHATRPGENGWQGSILLTPVSPNLDPLMNPCPINQAFTGGSQSWLELADQKAHIHLVVRTCQISGPLWPSIHLLEAGDSQPQDYPPLPSGSRTQILGVLPFNKNNPYLPLWTVSLKTQTEA